ncbi:MAG: hypothetical protein ACYDCO_12240 [Armatimonadota bacterium]
MKNTMLVIVLALIVVTTGLAFAQGAPEKAARAKEQFETKQRVMRAKSAFQQKQDILLNEEQAAKACHMMKKMELGITPPSDQSAAYPKCEMQCRMSGKACPMMEDGGIRGKQAVNEKMMMQNCPMHEKMQQHMEHHPAQPQGK